MTAENILPPEVDGYKLATLLGMSPRSVRDWAARGVLVRGSKPGLYKTFESLRAYLAHLRDGQDPEWVPPAARSVHDNDEHLKRLIREALAERADESTPARRGKSKKSGITGHD